MIFGCSGERCDESIDQLSGMLSGYDPYRCRGCCRVIVIDSTSCANQEGGDYI